MIYKKFFTNVRILIYIVFFIIMVLAINPQPWQSGVAIRAVEINSSASLAGIASPTPGEMPLTRERIVDINGVPIKNLEDFKFFLKTVEPNMSYVVTTKKPQLIYFSHKNQYYLQTKGNEDLGLTVYDAPKSNIKLGLDLQGGTRVLLEPASQVSETDLSLMIDIMRRRLNLFGLSDVVIREVVDLSGNKFILVEIAGINEKEVKELLAKQGKFEAKIGNQTVFIGGKDITSVCRTADCSGLHPSYGCQSRAGGMACRFYFQISLTPEAAQRHAQITRNLEVINEGGEDYLSQNLDLYLDDQLVDTLRIGAGLKGKAETSIIITGSGVGQNRQEAQTNSLNNMKQLRTVISTGSLPVKLNIIKTDTLSPSLGKEFLNNAILIGILSILAVTLIVVIRYREIIIATPIIIVIVSEIIAILGLAALLKQNLDIAGIAGIIVAIGTGVDDQIVITDETLSKEKEIEHVTFKGRIAKAFFIVIAAYVATMASMMPLLRAGAGLLRGFAITTMIGVSIGVFITRPAFAQMLAILKEED